MPFERSFAPRISALATGRLLAGFAGAALAATLAVPASAQVTKIQSNPNALILDAVDVKAGTDTIYLSGQLAAPLDPAKPMGPSLTADDFGDTKTQTISVLNKIKTILEARGYAMGDIIKLTLFVAADPKLGKMDFAGANDGFKTFFKTAENPSTVARSTFQVAALVAPQYLIEIEAIAAKKK
ncbi:Rid family hydrolase [Novosphingobium sp. SL115]|uniref:Rid family hydrolase n=1 Tax=Novosphingobium sp. SL115 TaxID=2995150 RepID=UPI002275F9A4|nr:Rid family hydrolase [Novosphingobium sp. SL115]MCY1672975.1 Rid family hydrolase [Novosphingobium sp. SL115]